MNKELLNPITQFREKISAFEDIMLEQPGSLVGHEMDEKLCPLKHTFVDGAYVREIFMPKGLILTSKIHKVEHPYFVMKGKCEVVTEEGIQLIEAPFHGITKPGTKRALHILEDTIWITIHVTNSTDLDEIEEQIIAKSFDDMQIKNEEKLKIKEN